MLQLEYIDLVDHVLFHNASGPHIRTMYFAFGRASDGYLYFFVFILIR